MTKIGFDLDETVTLDTNAIARYMARQLSVSVTEEFLLSLESYEAFHILPEVAEFRLHAPQVYQEAFRIACASLEVKANLLPRPGAVRGVHLLSRMAQGNAGYYTARSHEMREVSEFWLLRHGFPTLPYVSCFNFLQKIKQLYLDTREHEEPAILIDDNAEKIAKVWPQVVQKWPVIGELFPQRFILVAFGSTQETLFSHDVPFPVLPLPSWELQHIHNLVESIRALSFFKEEAVYVESGS